MALSAAGYIPLETINEDGSPPASRVADAKSAHAIIERFQEANLKRSKSDGEVYGLISGNTPWPQSQLDKNGESWRANFPTRIGESTFNKAKSRFEDLIMKSPHLAVVVTEHGKDINEQVEHSNIITEEFQRLNKRDKSLQYNLFLSIHDMVLFRCGPIIWRDDLDYRFKAVNQRYVLVDNEAQATVDEWTVAVVISNYSADQLYGFIRDSKAAADAGWDVKEARYALTHAAPANIWPKNQRYDWEWYEQRLRNNDIYYGRMSESIPVGHVYYREFPKGDRLEGKISHVSVLIGSARQEFLFRKVDRYERWQNFINPMYYDRGDGTHHSVKGYGIKGYPLWRAYDRLQCHLVDAGWMGSSMHFQAVTAQDLENLSITNLGPYVWHPPGGNFLMTQQLGGALEGPFAIKQDLLATVTENLAEYRSQLNRKKGNPATATQFESEHQEQEIVGESQILRFFEQLDDLWEERFRRASNPDLTLVNPGGKEALEFQERCRIRGVPMESLAKIECVDAYRPMGYGSRSLRSQAYTKLMSMFQLMDENGKQHLLEDAVTDIAGSTMAKRYVSKPQQSADMAEQVADATDKVASIKVGIPPKVAPSQNPFIYATVYLKAADEAAGTLAKSNGATAKDVYSFLEVAGPAIAEQLKRFENDVSRKKQHETLTEHWKQLAQLHDRLGKQLQRQAQEEAKKRQQQQQQMQQGMAEMNAKLAIKNRESMGKMSLAQRTKEHGMMLKQRMADQKMLIEGRKAGQQEAIADVKTAQEIKRKQYSAFKENA